jgi:hypothetical protein
MRTIQAGAVSLSLTNDSDTRTLDGNAVVLVRAGRVTSGYGE